MSIDRKAISALKWATVAKLVVQIASWAGTLMIVRLLRPEDYGLMAKVAVVCAIAGAIAELGLGAAIVRSVDMTRVDLQKVYGVSLFFGTCMTTVLVVTAPLLARLSSPPALALQSLDRQSNADCLDCQSTDRPNHVERAFSGREGRR